MSAENNIIKHFDNPDRAQTFAVSAFDSDWAEYYGLTFYTHNTERNTVRVTATYPGGMFTREVIFGRVSHAQSDSKIFGGKQ